MLLNPTSIEPTSPFNMPSYQEIAFSGDKSQIRVNVLEYDYNRFKRDFDFGYKPEDIILTKSTYLGHKIGQNQYVFDRYYHSDFDTEKYKILSRFDGLIKNLYHDNYEIPKGILAPPWRASHFTSDGLAVIPEEEILSKAKIISTEAIYPEMDVIDNMEVLEKGLQVDYMETFGLLEIPMIACSESFPMYAQIAFDSDTGANGKYKVVKKFFDRDLMLSYIKALENVIDKMYDIFRGSCQTKGLHLRMHVDISPFYIHISGFHKAHPDRKYFYKYNLLDSINYFNQLEDIHDYVDSEIYEAVNQNYTVPFKVGYQSQTNLYPTHSLRYRCGNGYSHIQ